MREDLLKVLTMLSEGKLNIGKSADLIEAMYVKEEKSLEVVKNYDKRMLRVLVDSADGDNVKINLPVVVITSILKATGKLPIKSADMEGIDFEMLTESIIAALDNEMIGDIITVDSSNGDVVRIIIE
ncbi:SHOCT-like domain-containing protein [Clostridium nigeriense]|uniref:SHOCT-like domain-containing protein n=1 Tax=Clostridium nigeriense TaxID=1805470 RepID=UPI003D3571C0